LALNNTVLGQAGKAPVALSIDLRVQAALDEELERAAVKFGVPDAVGIVTNIRTGEVLGLSSWPGFDPNAPGQAPPYNMVNRAAASVYEPGSVFKIFTMAMGLDSGSATLRSTYDVDTLQLGNRTIHDFHVVHGALTLPEVFVHSSNIGTAKLALQAGAPTLQRYFKAFGLFAPAKIELAEAARPILPKTWSDSTVASASFGQSISVSPLNLAAGIGAVLNGGQFVPLTIRKLDGPPPPGVRVVSQATSREMLDLMRLNVTAKEGSGGKADVIGLSVGGKTGTAQKVIGGRYSKDKVMASFAAVFPTDGPMDTDRYLVLIMLDDPKRLPETFGFATAGWNAAPAAGRVIDRIAPFVGVRRAAPTLADTAKSPAEIKPVEDETTSGELAQ
jgi:cell division protein FtsI (penicillin-binding protein 3)